MAQPLEIKHFGLDRQYPQLREELLDATDNVLKSGQFVDGRYTRQFEQWLADKTKTKFAVAVHSGTQALEILARYQLFNYYKLSHRDVPTIKLPNLTYPATLSAFLNAGFKVELVDTDKYGIIESAPYSLICLVGLYGKRPWIQYNLGKQVIIDGAQHWLVQNGEVGLGMAISFDPTKNLPSSGNSGAIVTNEPLLYRFAVNYRDNFKPTDFEEVGTNSKISEIEASHLLVRTKYIDKWQERRTHIARYWCEQFKELPLTCLNDTGDSHAHQKFVLYLPDRNSLHTHLLLNGVESRIHYKYVLGDLPIAKDLVKPDMLSTSVMLSRGVLSLPIYPELTDEEVEYIAEQVIRYK